MIPPTVNWISPVHWHTPVWNPLLTFRVDADAVHVVVPYGSVWIAAHLEAAVLVSYMYVSAWGNLT